MFMVLQMDTGTELLHLHSCDGKAWDSYTFTQKVYFPFFFGHDVCQWRECTRECNIGTVVTIYTVKSPSGEKYSQILCVSTVLYEKS